jgi:hypothetical protein
MPKHVTKHSSFERILAVSRETIELEFRAFPEIAWAEYLLNPRRLRGSDFLMRWSQGVWSEKRLIDAVNATTEYLAIPYGPSGTAPTDDVREFELYFERLDAAGLSNVKRPDLLLFRKQDKQNVEKLISVLGGIAELPFTLEKDLRQLLDLAVVAIECENSLWVSKRMPDYGKEFTPQKRLGGKLGLRKGAVVPTVIVKEEDRQPLVEWQSLHKVPIHIWHVFYDQAFGLSLDRAEQLVHEGLIEPTVQVFQAPGGATTRKVIYKYYYHYAYWLGESRSNPELIASFIQDKNGHILPYVKFEGGAFLLTSEATEVLDGIALK